ncbi:hypothetical protein KR200_004945 [Drosophila serrata]|nr:hypothetical protein KR200_004945 [Drosophila serrata]
MSNLQDVPLAEPEVLPVADSEEAQMSKANSLKRFFKISKKPAVKEYGSDVSLNGDNKELRKTSTLSRLFSRKKLPTKDGANKDGPNKDEPEQSSSMGTPMTQEKPEKPNPKAVKSSMSMYWKRLFHLHKAQNQEGGSGLDQGPVNGPEEVHELKLVQNDSEVQGDLDEPDLEPEKEPKQPVTTSEAEPKKIASRENIQSTLDRCHNLSSEPKDEEAKQPDPAIANLQ